MYTNMIIDITRMVLSMRSIVKDTTWAVTEAGSNIRVAEFFILHLYLFFLLVFFFSLSSSPIFPLKSMEFLGSRGG
jgi:hypothetical protein